MRGEMDAFAVRCFIRVAGRQIQNVSQMSNRKKAHDRRSAIAGITQNTLMREQNKMETRIS